jgi:paraquat-inducible protein B
MDIYCGAKKVPKNKRIGSMVECAEKGQVMYWGLKKIDNRVMENVQSQKKVSLDKARTNKIKLDTRLKKMLKDLENAKDKEKKQTLKKDIEKTKKELEKATKEFKEAFKLSEEKKASKNSSKKETKKSTKKSTKKQTKTGKK